MDILLILIPLAVAMGAVFAVLFVRAARAGQFDFDGRAARGLGPVTQHAVAVGSRRSARQAAGVVGIPDPAVGQQIKAYVVLQSEARGKISEEEILEFCRQNLAHYKVPQIIEFRGELPKTDVGKISRRELREEAEEA